MRYTKFIFATTALFAILLFTGGARAQWGSATLEPVVTTGDNDQVGQSSLALDDQGALHLVFDRASGGNHQLYYTRKLQGGDWIDPVMVDSPGSSYEDPYLSVFAPSGVAYLVYIKDGLSRLGLASECVWEYYDLQVPYLQDILDPCVAVDADGNAHIAMIVYIGNEYKIAYGYWDGSPDFHFQILYDSELGAFGSGASPDICVKSDGSVAICYRGGGYLTYRVDVAENDGLGGTNWTYQSVEVPGYECYPGAIKSAENDDLHLGFNGNMGFGFPNDVFYAVKPSGSPNWSTPVEVGGTLGGADVKLAVENDGDVHIAFMETSGNFYTGNIVYATNQSGSWTAQYLLTGDKYNPTLLVDPQGNGSLAFHQYAGYQNYDVYYYGYVAPQGPPPDVDITLIPENPPIQIPAAGGSFSFTLEITNNTPLPVSFDVWTEVLPPGGGDPIELLMTPDVTMGPSSTRAKLITQFVPGRAPAGTYIYRGYAGYYPATPADADSFIVEKLGDVGDADWSQNEWMVSDQDLASVPQNNRLLNAYPNPFNPVTTFRFTLSDPGEVSLRIYDLRGRIVAEPVKGYRQAGDYEVHFDAEDLPSGIYFAYFNAGGIRQIQKITLLK